MEALYLMERGRFRFINRQNENIDKVFIEFVSMIEQSDNYQIVPIDSSLMRFAVSLKGLEIHDRLILATTILTDTKLISKDRQMRTIGLDIVYW